MQQNWGIYDARWDNHRAEVARVEQLNRLMAQAKVEDGRTPGGMLATEGLHEDISLGFAEDFGGYANKLTNGPTWKHRVAGAIGTVVYSPFAVVDVVVSGVLNIPDTAVEAAQTFGKSKVLWDNGYYGEALEADSEAKWKVAETLLNIIPGYQALRSGGGALRTLWLGASVEQRVVAGGAGAAANTAEQTVSLFGFRGAGTPEDLLRDTAPHPYVITGHVGYSFDGGRTICGFRPRVPDGMSAYDAVQSLRNGASHPGMITDDTRIFRAVAENPVMSRAGLPQEVIEQRARVSQAELDSIKALHTGLGVDKPFDDVLHGFPGQNACTFNCATFPTRLGIPIPETSGNMRAFIPALERSGQPWRP